MYDMLQKGSRCARGDLRGLMKPLWLAWVQSWGKSFLREKIREPLWTAWFEPEVNLLQDKKSETFLPLDESFFYIWHVWMSCSAFWVQQPDIVTCTREVLSPSLIIDASVWTITFLGNWCSRILFLFKIKCFNIAVFEKAWWSTVENCKEENK